MLALLMLAHILVGVVGLASPSRVEADTIGFEGTVTFVSTPPSTASPGLFAVGDALKGTYLFDASALILPSPPDPYVYPSGHLKFAVGGHAGTSPAGGSAYFDQSPPFGFPYYCAPGFVTCPAIPLPLGDVDMFLYGAHQEDGATMPGLGSYSLVDFFLVLEDTTNTAVPPTSDAILRDPPDLGAFQARYFILSFCAGFCPDDQFVVVGEVTSITQVSSAPTLLLLLGAGAAGTALGSRRRRI